MAAPLNTCTTIEQRGIVRFFAKKYGSKGYPQRNAGYVRADKYRRRTVGRPVEITTLETLQLIKDIIRADRRVITNTIVTAIGCSHGQAYNMMHNGLGFHKVCSCWVMMRLKEQCARGSDSNHKNFTWQVSRDL
ncbi:hypothetical protein J437_LFUL013149 [Ladona fulva]|uniref:Uncharacterized protein n=1 Tax=Ladona fulva TaxID=123851 RepID=A0A8K0P6G2_LADFU|nr:hypothetical protein J437_LFUL013149 [Ladona fulva]